MIRGVLLLLVPAIAAADPPHVKIDDAAKAITDAIAKVDLRNTKAGETLTIASLEQPDTTKPIDTATLRTALGTAKLKIIDDRTVGEATTITVEDPIGSRARIAIDRGGGAILLTAKPSTITPPGKCVAIPDARHPVRVHASAINQDGEFGQGETFFDYKTERIHDVDGDGITDAFVPVAKDKNACPEEVSFRVFVVRGNCGHDVGVIGPGSFQWDAGTVALEKSGFRPFTMSAETSRLGKGMIPEMTTTVRRFAFSSGKYRQATIKTSRGVCHHCATWHCSAGN